MDVFLEELRYHARQLQKEDKTTTISGNILGYLALNRSGLSDREKTFVLGQTGSSYDFDKVSSQLRNLYPEGTQDRRAFRPGHRHGAMAIFEEDVMDEYGGEEESWEPEAYEEEPLEEAIYMEEGEGQETANSVQ